MDLNQVTIPVSDMDRSVAFYQALGLKLIVLTPHYARFECPGGTATFSLHKNTPSEPGYKQQEPGDLRSQLLPDTNPDGAWIYFEVTDVDATCKDLAEKGITLDTEPEDQPWLWREARLRDPDGQLLIIYHAGINRKDPPWRLPG